MNIKACIVASRPQFLIFWILLALVGAAMAGFPRFDLFGITLLGICLIVVSCHLRDEFKDWESGRDLDTGGMGVIRRGEMTIVGLRRLSYAFLGAALCVGAILVYLTGWPVLVFALLGLLSYSVLHRLETIPIVREWQIILTVGLAVLGTCYIQAASVGVKEVYTFFMLAFLLVPGVVFMQDVPDIEQDRKSGKQTIFVRFGVERGTGIAIAHALVGLVMFLIYLIVW